MPLSRIAALALNYLHRSGGRGEQQAVVDYLQNVEGYSEAHARRACRELADEGAIDRQRGGGGRSSLFNIDYESDYYNGDDGL